MNHLYRAILQDRADGQRRDLAEMTPSFREEGEELGQHLVGGDQPPRGEQTGCAQGHPVPLISRVGDGYPKIGVGEDVTRGAGFFGAP